MTTFKFISITPDELLDAARTIPLGRISTCNWLNHWIPATTFLEWAKRGLKEGDAYGFSNAICYAKRSATCRIDILIQYNHLSPFLHVNYPDKIDALTQVGISIPDVVHDLVIEPRNALEHDYQNPSEKVARHAVDIAELFIGASVAEFERSSIVAVNWNIQGSQLLSSKGSSVNFRGFSNEPMLFVDVFEKTFAVKIIDAKNNEIRFTNLSAFNKEHAFKFSQLLRGNYSQGSLSQNGSGQNYFREMKKQGGF
jgi:hypothetical protein